MAMRPSENREVATRLRKMLVGAVLVVVCLGLGVNQTVNAAPAGHAGLSSLALTQTGPAITSLSPTVGLVGSSVTITGTGFGATPDTVTFSGTSNPVVATSSSWNDTNITVTVPTGATSGNVLVTVGTATSNGVVFTVNVPPSIRALAPSSGLVGTSVSIVGSGFGTTQGSSTVTFNGVQATPSSWSAGNIILSVPAGATSGNVVINVAGTTSNGANFTLIPPPSITSLTPTSGIIGASVAIAGSGFGSTQGASTVAFNGVQATPSSWSDGSIVMPVPASATTGNVVVTASGVASGGASFTVMDFGLSASPVTINMLPTGPTSGSASFTLTPVNGYSGAVSYSCSNLSAGGTCSTSGGTPVSGSVISGTLTVTVPQGTSGSTTFTLIATSGSLQHSSSANLTVIAPPNITSLSPSAGITTTPVTITGTGFGTSAGTVTFNGTTGSGASWGDTTITVSVPSAAPTGNVVVTTSSGVQSIGKPFVVMPSPVISSLSPGSLPAGSRTFTMTLIGSGFVSGSQVKWNDASPPTTYVNATELTVVIPTADVATAGTASVIVVNPGGGGTSSAATFTILSNAYSFSKAILVDHTKVGSSDSTSFPMLFSGTYSDLATTGNGGNVTSSGGYDIIFTSDPTCSTQVPWEIESYDPTTGKVSFWINIATLSHTADTLIYMCYGNSSVTTFQSNAQSVWDTNFIGVYHFGNGTTLSLGDSTSHNNGLTNSGGTASTGEVGGAVALNGSQYANTTSTSGLPSGSAVRTVEAWIKPSATSVSGAFGFGANSGSGSRFLLTISSSTLGLDVQNASATIPFTSDSAWHHLVAEVPSGTTVNSIQIYLDGQAKTTTYTSGSTTLATSTANITVGSTPGSLGTGNWNGSVDEGRISNVARSADWITAEYNNQSAPSTFYTVATTPWAPTIASVSPNSTTVGSSVTVTGVNFGATPGSITFNGTTATGATWGDTSITVSVPTGATTGSIVVTTAGSVASNGVSFTVVSPNPTPVLGSLSRTSALAGSSDFTLTLTGTSFISSSQVQWSGSNSPTTYVSATQLTAAITAADVATVGTASVTVMNPLGGTSNGVTFTITAPVYGYRYSVIVDHTKVGSSDSSNFPMLFSGAYSYLATTANGGNVSNSSGYDIIFTSDQACSTPIPWEIESYDPTTGKVNFWINISSLNHSTDTVIFMCYGNPSITTFQGNASGVWDSNFSAVYHFTNGAALGLLDSTSNHNNLTNTGATVGTGQIGSAITTNGSQYANDSSTSSLPSGSTTRTVEAWIQPTNTAASEAFGYGANSVTGDRFSLYSSGSGLYGELEGVASGITYTFDGGWHHLVLELPSGNTVSSIQMYLDGVPETVTYYGGATVLNTSTDNITVGSIPGALGAGNWVGSVDEARISKVARSADWITAEYNNQKSPSTFYSVGSSTAPTILGLFPTSAAPGATVTVSGFNFGATQGASTVTVNGTNATVASWGNTSVVISVPAGATTGNIVVTVSTVASNVQAFTVLTPNPTPVLSSISPTSAFAGTASFTLTLTGSSFVSSSQVQWNGLSLATTFVNSTQLAATITAADIATPGSASVTVVNPAPAGGASSASTLTISPVAYGSSRSITIDHTKVGSQNSTGFPMLFSNTYSFLATIANGGNVTNSNGYDIVFGTDSACMTRIPWEIESYNPATGNVVLWINIPNLSHTADTVIYICYGSSLISTLQSNPQTVWDGNFAAVYHLSNGGAASLADSTANNNSLGNDGVVAGTGQIGGAIVTNIGKLARTIVPAGLPGGAATRTLEAWFTNSSTVGAILSYGPNSQGSGRIVLSVSGSVVGASSDNASASVAYTPDGHWHHLAAELPSGNTVGSLQIYLDGQPKTVTYSNGTTVLNTATSDITIGDLSGYTSQYPLIGSVDEARISTIARSASWILAEYNNQSSPSTFYSVSSTPPVITGLSRTSGAVGDTVLISGSNFGPTAGTVTFNGTTASSVSDWEMGIIAVAVPAGSTTGNVVITTAGTNSSNGVIFTVTHQTAVGSLTPGVGPIGSLVTIAGSGFGATAGTVTFNGSPNPIVATQTSWTDTSIVVTVPSGALTGGVLVVVNGLSSSQPFTVSPTISSMSSQSAAVGSSPLTLVVTGSGFTLTSQVMWSNSGRQTTYISPTTLNAVINAGDLGLAGTYLVCIQNLGSGTSGSLPFTVGSLSGNLVKEYMRLGGRVLAIYYPPAAGPSISALSPASGAVNTSVTIIGATFGPTPGTVTFGGTTATVTSWSDTSIVVTVPSGATTSNVVVTINNLASNGVNFTVTP